MTTYTIHFDAIAPMTEESFEQLCRANPAVKFERTADGIIVGTPAAGSVGLCRAKLIARLVVWNEHTGFGEVFDTAGFRLSNGAVHSPTLAWIRKERWNKIPPEQQATVPAIAPDFVVEVMSGGNAEQFPLWGNCLEDTQARMRDYLENGVKFGWLMDSSTHRVEIYRLDQPVNVLHDPELLSGEDILPGLMLNLRAIW